MFGISYDYISSPWSKAVISNGRKNSGIYVAVTMTSSKRPVCPLMEVVLPMETLSIASLFAEDFDSFRSVTYESEAEESEWDVEDDSEREPECGSKNNSDNGGSKR